MFGNRVKETTTTTGAGNLTLAGAETNFQTLNAVFSTNRRFTYWIIDDTNTAWEIGIGYLSASTTLVRERILGNSSGTYVALTLAAGTKTVINGPAYQQTSPTIPVISSGATKAVFGSNWRGGRSTQGDILADRVYHVPHKLEYGGRFDAFILSVETLGLASKGRAGIYSVAADGEPGQLLVESADIDTTTTGIKTSTFTEIELQPDWYFISWMVNVNTVAIDGISAAQDNAQPNPLGLNSTSLEPIPHVLETVTAGWTSLPAGGGTYTYTDDWRATPCVNLRPA